jgi:hypothetical protein
MDLGGAPRVPHCAWIPRKLSVNKCLELAKVAPRPQSHPSNAYPRCRAGNSDKNTAAVNVVPTDCSLVTVNDKFERRRVGVVYIIKLPKWHLKGESRQFSMAIWLKGIGVARRAVLIRSWVRCCPSGCVEVSQRKGGRLLEAAAASLLPVRAVSVCFNVSLRHLKSHHSIVL